MSRILIVDDVLAMREQYAYDIKRLGNHETLTAASGDEALLLLEREVVDCMILDLEMPRVDGFELLKTLQHQGPDLPVIVYTGTGSIERCVRAMKLGAASFVEKTDAIERVLFEIDRVLSGRRLRAELKRARRQAEQESELVGESEAMGALKDAIARVAAIPSTVLILGESGSGKELVARRLHELSGRQGPFLAVNCAAFPEQTLEDELFGHVKGAFTGADRARKGAFEEAEQGTLLLDEIGDLSAPAQAKLLRVLEEGQIQRLGSSQPVKVDARVLAATHRDLPAEAEAGRFRNDLLFRLNTHVLRVPPLRDRLEDLPLLCEHLLARLGERLGLAPRRLAAETLEALSRYDWHRNNVRELRNALERMLIATDGDEIGPEAVPAELWSHSAEQAGESSHSFRDQRLAAERRIVAEALARNGGQLTKTARELGLADHSSLSKLMKRLGLEGRD